MSFFCNNSHDTSTNSNYQDVTIKNIHLDWEVSFGDNLISGVAILSFLVLSDTKEIILDSNNLAINSVKYMNMELEFCYINTGHMDGSILINAPFLEKGLSGSLVIDYQTESNPGALQFLSKEQTNDKVASYLYSHCQPCYARSIIPCMDTPSVKQTYTASVTVPRKFTVLMSALSNGCSKISNNRVTYHFYQPIPIPSYLFAIVVGYITRKNISERCAVWSEESTIWKAHFELLEIEKILQIIERLLGPYKWGRLDFIVHPDSFPIGGVENPCCIFLPTTFLTGDRSLLSVVIHEIIHSWIGNTVTIASWEHYWLKEGFTVFLERKIIGILYGEKIRDLEYISEWANRLEITICNIFGCQHEFTKMVPDLSKSNPDDAISFVPIEKGSALILVIEQFVNDSGRFEQFIRDYIRKFENVPITTDRWLDYLFDYFKDKKSSLNSINYNQWIKKPGVPPNKPLLDNSLWIKCIKLSYKWIDASDDDLCKSNFMDATIFNEMSSTEQSIVLNFIIRYSRKISIYKAMKLTELYKLDERRNCEITMLWLCIGLIAEWEGIIYPALKFVNTYGQIDSSKAIYKLLLRWSFSKSIAIKNFFMNQHFMHPSTRYIIYEIISKEC
uniref:Leuk-A4-hydro_C domain-containing protein n=1 Tax=Strongyloides stercoralis TaxID=6248 RepID=A0A0K0EG61_STRER